MKLTKPQQGALVLVLCCIVDVLAVSLFTFDEQAHECQFTSRPYFNAPEQVDASTVVVTVVAHVAFMLASIILAAIQLASEDAESRRISSIITAVCMIITGAVCYGINSGCISSGVPPTLLQWLVYLVPMVCLLVLSYACFGLHAAIILSLLTLDLWALGLAANNEGGVKNCGIRGEWHGESRQWVTSLGATIAFQAVLLCVLVLELGFAISTGYVTGQRSQYERFSESGSSTCTSNSKLRWAVLLACLAVAFSISYGISGGCYGTAMPQTPLQSVTLLVGILALVFSGVLAHHLLRDPLPVDVC